MTWKFDNKTISNADITDVVFVVHIRGVDVDNTDFVDSQEVHCIFFIFEVSENFIISD